MIRFFVRRLHWNRHVSICGLVHIGRTLRAITGLLIMVVKINQRDHEVLLCCAFTLALALALAMLWLWLWLWIWSCNYCVTGMITWLASLILLVPDKHTAAASAAVAAAAAALDPLWLDMMWVKDAELTVQFGGKCRGDEECQQKMLQQ
jgi:hypothetical protein